MPRAHAIPMKDGEIKRLNEAQYFFHAYDSSNCNNHVIVMGDRLERTGFDHVDHENQIQKCYYSDSLFGNISEGKDVIEYFELSSKGLEPVKSVDCHVLKELIEENGQLEKVAYISDTHVLCRFENGPLENGKHVVHCIYLSTTIVETHLFEIPQVNITHSVLVYSNESGVRIGCIHSGKFVTIEKDFYDVDGLSGVISKDCKFRFIVCMSSELRLVTLNGLEICSENINAMELTYMWSEKSSCLFLDDCLLFVPEQSLYSSVYYDKCTEEMNNVICGDAISRVFINSEGGFVGEFFNGNMTELFNFEVESGRDRMFGLHRGSDLAIMAGNSIKSNFFSIPTSEQMLFYTVDSSTLEDFSDVLLVTDGCSFVHDDHERGLIIDVEGNVLHQTNITDEEEEECSQLLFNKHSFVLCTYMGFRVGNGSVMSIEEGEYSLQDDVLWVVTRNEITCLVVRDNVVQYMVSRQHGHVFGNMRISGEESNPNVLFAVSAMVGESKLFTFFLDRETKTIAVHWIPIVTDEVYRMFHVDERTIEFNGRLYQFSVENQELKVLECVIKEDFSDSDEIIRILTPKGGILERIGRKMHDFCVNVERIVFNSDFSDYTFETSVLNVAERLKEAKFRIIREIKEQ
ncbi:hypothetical protein PCE1_000973 [Barthelona sp. PCE]